MKKSTKDKKKNTKALKDKDYSFEKADDASDISGQYGSENDGEEAEDEADSEALHSKTNLTWIA